MKIGDYKSVEELLEHMDSEGGLEYFFTQYVNTKQFINTPLENVVANFIEAHQKLKNKLEELLEQKS